MRCSHFCCDTNFLRAGAGAEASRHIERQLLCPSIERLQRLSCAELGSADVLTGLLAKIGWTGLLLEPRDLAMVLLGLAHHSKPRNESLRFVSTEPANGWAAAHAAAFLQRLHGGSLHGLLVASGRSEPTPSPPMRTLMGQLNLTLRGAHAFDARNESALVTHLLAHRHARHSVSHSLAPATRYLPAGWEEWPPPPPFDVCLRASGRLDAAALVETDWRRSRLAAWCVQFAFYGEREASLLAAYAQGAGAHGVAHQAGNFTIMTSPRSEGAGEDEPRPEAE